MRQYCLEAVRIISLFVPVLMMLSRKTTEDRARELHSQAIVIDGHSDILIPVTEGKMAFGDRVEVPDPETWIALPGLEQHPLVKFGAQPRTNDCLAGIVGLSGLSLPWLLLLGTTFIFRRRKRSFCERKRSFCERKRNYCDRTRR